MTTTPADPLALSRAQWRATVGSWGQPAYRGDQIHRWIHVDLASSFEEMTNLSKGLRGHLARDFPEAFRPPEIVQSADRGTTLKALFRAPDGAPAETVLMAYPTRATVCVSSQAGCGLACPFCATGQMGLVRNLSVSEIVGQVLWAARTLRGLDVPDGRPRRVTDIVLMGMGEPLANYARVWAAVERIHDPEGFNLSARSITCSTVGLVPEIRRLASERLPISLALSLHAPDDELRNRLVPMNTRYPIAEVLAACREFRRAHGRRVSIEYVMISGVNDSEAQAVALADLLRGDDFHVNLIPLNPTSGWELPPSPPRNVDRFLRTLTERGVNATVRQNRGADIDAACGQLTARAAGS